MKRISAKQSAFFNVRVLLGSFVALAGIFLALVAFGLYPGASALAEKPSRKATQQWQPHWVVVHSLHNDVSAPLREMATLPLRPLEGEHEAAENPKIGILRASGSRPDTVVQNSFLKRLAASLPIPGINFDGIPFPGVVCNCAPPDTDGYVGKTQYVQIVNEGYQVFDKFTGTSTLGPASIRSVWAGFGGVCETGGSGDPVVLYDKLADRWLLSQFAAGLTHECVAVSTTSDATGSYYRYDFDETPFGNNEYDYPKIGSWPDAYYMSVNVFSPSYLGTQAFAFDRNKMLCGLPASIISPGLIGSPANNEDPVMPADFDGTVLPPPGAPNTFVEFPDVTGNNNGTYRLWHFHVGSPFGAGMTFTQVASSPPAAPFTFLQSNVPQLAPQTSLDNLADRLMFRFAYRNYGTPSAPDESVVANLTVNSNGVAGVRWFELKDVTNGPVTVHQESTYQPDTTWRWMASVAMDHSSNVAVGFSASDSTIHPQIRYAVRVASIDPPSTLGGETHMFDGTGSQSATNSRWGDYSAMTVDPTDDTTMWYTQEYYATNSSFNWRTRIGSFRIDPNQPLINVSAKSRLTQGAAGPYDLDLPLYAGSAGPGRAVESRSASSYTIVFNFTNPITGVDPTVTTSCGTATATIGSDSHQVLATLSAGSCNGQYITVQLNNVTDGTSTISPSVTFGLLIGDTNGNGNVNGADVSQAKSQSGIAACPPNFRLDVNGNGVIDATDVSLVKSKSGTALPTPP